MRDQTPSILNVYAESKSLAEIGLLTFLSQSAVGGGLAAFAALLVFALVSLDPWKALVVIFLPVYLFFGGLAGVIAGVIVWLACRNMKQRPGIILRIIIAIAFLHMVTVVFCSFTSSELDWLLLMFALAFNLVLGISVGTLAGSNIRPLRLIAYGIAADRTTVSVMFHNGPIRISRLIEGSKFSFLAGLPVRATSLLALMMSVLATACTLSFFLWDREEFKNHDELIGAAIATLYFGVTVWISLVTRRKAIALAMAVLLNGPLSVWILNQQPSPDTYVLSGIASVFIFLWLLLVAGLLFDKPRGGQLRVEYDPGESRFAKQHLAKVFK